MEQGKREARNFPLLFSFFCLGVMARARVDAKAGCKDEIEDLTALGARLESTRLTREWGSGGSRVDHAILGQNGRSDRVAQSKREEENKSTSRGNADEGVVIGRW